MLKEERLWRITNMLVKEGKVISSQLAREFNMTLASVRLDLMELERRGVAKRVYGGAFLLEDHSPTESIFFNEPHLNERFNLQLKEKEAIGRTTAKLLFDKETVMIDGGTTTYHVCKNLIDKRYLTVISCTMFTLWRDLAARSDLQIFLTGGFLRKETSSLVGELAEYAIRCFRANKAVLGIDGISLDMGFTTFNFLEAGIKRRMIEASEELIIVADHTKFDKLCPIPVAPLDCACTIVTDDRVSRQVVASLEEHGIKVIIAEVE
jgi:DeoR family transcriptional regulator, fructose operon transcriptional repressor